MLAANSEDHLLDAESKGDGADTPGQMAEAKVVDHLPHRKVCSKPHCSTAFLWWLRDLMTVGSGYTAVAIPQHCSK
jgi:hypothetical protein